MIATGQILIIGDSHIGLSDGSEKAIVGWLERVARVRPKALYLNGDLFHYLIAHPKFTTTSVERVFARFRELRDTGTAVHYVEGNRDFFIKGSFAEEAVSDVALEYEVAAGAKKYLVVHGDMINDRDYQYRFWRRASKNPLSKFALHFIPKGTARKFVDGVEKKLSQTNFKHKTQLPISLMEAYGRKRAREGFTHVVFGHFHEKRVLAANGTTIAILPPWYETQEAMVIDPTTGEFSFVVI